MSSKLTIAVLAIVGTIGLAGEKLDVKIIDRQNNSKQNNYTIPGSAVSVSSGSASCLGGGISASCVDSSRTDSVVIPARSGSYSVRGATLAIQLPDGRVAVVNCESKYAPKGDFVNRRSCRVPLVDRIVAEFNGDNAKLFWAVSIDGKKQQSETYKILGVLDRPEEK